MASVKSLPVDPRNEFFTKGEPSCFNLLHTLSHARVAPVQPAPPLPIDPDPRMSADTMVSLPTHQQIAERAHAIYQAAGCPEGCALDHWLQAEKELLENCIAALPRFCDSDLVDPCDDDSLTFTRRPFAYRGPFARLLGSAA